MFLKEYINNIKTDKSFFENKSWLNREKLIEHFEEKKIPTSASEEWKNFRTTELNKINWEVPNLNKEIIINEEVKKTKNSIVLRNGFLIMNFLLLEIKVELVLIVLSFILKKTLVLKKNYIIIQKSMLKTDFQVYVTINLFLFYL